MLWFAPDDHTSSHIADEQRTSIPVGVPCGLCSVPFTETDSGYIVPSYSSVGVVSEPIITHAKCLVESITGEYHRRFPQPPTTDIPDWS